MSSQNRVTIIGGGWSGLAAAIELAEYNFAVTLIESNKTLGGRARNINLEGNVIDNGQHLMIGAYTELLRLMNLLGLEQTAAFERQSTLLHSLSYKHKGYQLSLPKLAAPYHFLYGLIDARGLSVLDKLRVISLCVKLNIDNFKIDKDQTLASWLSQKKQSERLIMVFWRPLCLAILNTPIEAASTEVFLNVLKDCFTVKRDYSDFLFAKSNIGNLFPIPAERFLKEKNTIIRLGIRAKRILREDSGFQIETSSDTFTSNHLVLATPPKHCAKLIQNLDGLSALYVKLKKFKTSPITTIYLQYPEDVQLGKTMLGISGGMLEWLIDRRLSEQPGLIAAVISGPGQHMQFSKAELEKIAIAELRCLFPHWPAPQSVAVVREKRATFLCEKNINSWRPDNQTPIDNLWLAGDYTNTQYPATLEGAIRSGISCAKKIIQTVERK